jgi:hypothetical protein
MNKPGDKGRMAENGLVSYLTANGWPYVERRRLTGANDKGDITGTPGLCWEVKYANAGLRLGAWMAETALETLNAGAEYGVLVVKPLSLGLKSVHHWYAIMSADEHAKLMFQAGALDEMFLPEPFTFTAGNLAYAMINARIGRNSYFSPYQGQMFAVTAVPPGCKDRPSQHYRVMYLEEMVRLLRQAGYGSPNEDSGGVPREAS